MPIDARNSSGLRNDEKIDARNVRRYCIARSSTTRVMAAIALLDQRAAGQPQEDVLEARPPDQDGLGPESPVVGRGDGGLPVVGVEEHPIREELDPLRQAIELPVERLLDPDREAQLRDLAG